MTLRHILRVVLGLAGLLALATAPARAQTAVRVEDGALVLPVAVHFEAGSDTLADGSEAGLEAVSQFLADKTYITLLRVETNAAALASNEANMALGMARAKRLAAWFAAHGTDCKRLIFVTHGPNKPAGTGEENERVEFKPATLRGFAIGGMPVDGGGWVVEAPCS